MPVTTGNPVPRLGQAAQPQALGMAPGAELKPELRVTPLPRVALLSGQDRVSPPILPGVPEGSPRGGCP